MTYSDRPRLGEKLCYGCGDFASVLYWQTISVHLFFFYTDVFGISAAAFGWMVILSRNFDAINDPAMGMFADRTQTRWGNYRPFLLWLCVPFALMGVLMFTTPNLGDTGKLIWAFVTFNGFMILYTAINIPYTSLLGVISPDPKERTSVASIKFTFAYVAALLVQAGMLPLARALGGAPENPKGWQLGYGIIGVVAIGFFLVTWAGTRERVQPPAKQKVSVKGDLCDLFTNGPWLILLPMTFTFILFVSTRLIVINHYFKYYVGPREVSLPWLGTGTYEFDALASAFGLVGMTASIFGALFVGWFARLTGKKSAFFILMSIAIVSTGVFYFLRPDQLFAMFVWQTIGSFVGGPLSAVLWAMYSDTADYGEWKHGRRSTGLVFSASTMAQKFGWAFGIAAAGWALSAAGFVKDMDPTPEVQNTLILFMSLIPALVGVIPLAIMAFYPLTDRRMASIEADLKARRAGDEPAAAPAA